jgi:hypothetical protein
MENAELDFVVEQLLSEIVHIATGYQLAAYPGLGFHERTERLHHPHDRGHRHIAE